MTVPKEIPLQGKCCQDMSAPMQRTRRRKSGGRNRFGGKRQNHTQIHTKKEGCTSNDNGNRNATTGNLSGLRPIRKKGRKIITNSKHTYLTRRVGSTTYKVRVHFSENSQETMEDKIIRLIRNDALDSKAECGIMELPQMSRQPERSAT